MSGRGGHGGGEGGRKKRAKPDEGSWDCTVCTFHNTADAFKCLMCDTRKGTSTRKPKLNSHLEEQVEQVVRQLSAHQTKKPRLSLNRDVPSPPSPPSPFDRDFDDRPSSSATAGMLTSVKGKGIGKNKKGGIGKKATVVAPIIEDDEDDDGDREEDDDEEEEEVKEEKKKKTSNNIVSGKSATGKTIKGSAAIDKFEKSDKAEKKTSSSATPKKEKEPKVKVKTTEKKEKDVTSALTTSTMTTTTTTATAAAVKKGKKGDKDEPEPKRRLQRLKNVDRSTANSMAVTVNNITVIITDFKPKVPTDVSSQSEKKTKAES